VTKQGSPVLESRTLADLAQYRWGAQVGTLYYIAITEDIQPTRRPRCSTPRPTR
jgi:hypothetical protein